MKSLFCVGANRNVTWGSDMCVCVWCFRSVSVCMFGREAVHAFVLGREISFSLLTFMPAVIYGAQDLGGRN